jgi:hypothetical protein
VKTAREPSGLKLQRALGNGSSNSVALSAVTSHADWSSLEAHRRVPSLEAATQDSGLPEGIGDSTGRQPFAVRS